MYSIADALAAPKARAGAVNSTTAHVLRSLQELCSTFGARAAITSWCGELHHRRTCCDGAMYPTAGARAAIKQTASVTPQRLCCRNSSLRV